MARSARPTRFRDRWRIRWIDHTGERRSAVLASYEEADRELRRVRCETDEILRGAREPAPADRTFKVLADHWLATRAKEKRTEADDASMLRCHLVPAFGALALREIRGTEIERYKIDRAHLSPKTVANHLTLLVTMLRAAVENGWLVTVPTIRKPKADPDDDVDQPWLRTRADIDRFLEAARAEIEAENPFSEVPFVLYSTAVYSGARAGELAGLRWADVDLERRTISIRRSYDGKTKTRASRRHVPIMDVLHPTLRAWRMRCPVTEGDFVFPNHAASMHGPSSRIFQEILHRVLDRAKFARPVEGRSRHVIHFHSLRHTFACHWRLEGGPLDELIRVLGHTSKAMTEHYANVGGYHRPEHFKIFSNKKIEDRNSSSIVTKHFPAH